MCARLFLSFWSANKYRRRLCVLFNDAPNCWDCVSLTIEERMSMEPWWNYDYKGKTGSSEKNLSYCHFSQKTNIDWPGIEPGFPQSILAMALPNAKFMWHNQTFANVPVKSFLLHESHMKYQPAFTDINILKILHNVSNNTTEELALDIDSRTTQLVG